MSGWFAPGRIEVLGKHTDYAGGSVLICSVDRGITCTISDRRPASGLLTAHSGLDDNVVDITPGAQDPLPAGHWGHYLRAAAARLQDNFGRLRPVHLEISSDLPPASGMSSSSALVVAAAMALADDNGLSKQLLWQEQIADEVQLAAYLACLENGKTFGALRGSTGVGTQGGSEDHTAILCSRAGELGWFRFNPPQRVDQLPMSAGHVFVIAVSGVAAEKTGAARDAYNAASRRATRILERWNDAGHDDAWLADAVAGAGLDAVERVVSDDPDLVARLRQFDTEANHCIPQAVAALQSGDLTGFADAVARSQAAAHAGLGNQVPATESLVERALDLGAVGASSFGAGFGGSVWAMVPETQADEFAAAWLQDHVSRFPDLAKLANTLVTRPSPAVRRV